MRVERVDEPDTRCRDGSPGPSHQDAAGCVPGVLAFGDVAGAQLGEAHLAGARGKKRAGAGGDRRARLAGEGRAGCDGLEVPAPAAAAHRAVELDRDVAEFAGHPVGAVEQPAVRDDRATDTGRHRDVDEVVLAAAGAVGRLGERGDVRVAVEECREAERHLHIVSQRHVPELRTEVRRLDNCAGARVDRAGAGDADAHDRLADLERRSVARGDEGGRTRVDDGGGAELAWRLGRDAGQS